jgi:hypothetical protein
MKNILILESAEEVLKAFNPSRQEGDEFPCLGTDVYLVVEDEGMFLSGKPDIGLQISSKVSFDDIADEALKKLNVRIHRT